ncbi:dienelactone hydrolase family protein [Neoroseomonas soli]|uniref:Alpha/beta hydrolase n=1 Tax=Neoroseomonas soli TaxID=1081025 RepID=A0A9X9WTI8_9PROT|nr:dienelactone hydrolase family protein [Neoroseomonas soli]MBR0670467.1 alpha/beta hydrolase [Neoroseomonas soli]
MDPVPDSEHVREEAMAIPPAGLEAILALPPAPAGLVVFAHGSGSSRFSPRNRLVAAALHEAGFATLLFDLLAEAEARDRRNVFDIGLLARRLGMAIDHAAVHYAVSGLPLGLFGASTGAAAALTAAAARPARVGAVVSRGGRPDLATEPLLARIVAPTLLIVGGEDREVLALNRLARARMACPTELAVVPGATHLFEEPGALEEVARRAAAWFSRFLGPKALHTAR